MPVLSKYMLFLRSAYPASRLIFQRGIDIEPVTLVVEILSKPLFHA